MAVTESVAEEFPVVHWEHFKQLVKSCQNAAAASLEVRI
jgi:hypothetical protein